MFTQFQEWYDKRHEYAKDWKQRTGGKVMGCFCSYVPEEMLVAGNILPVRILGSHEPQNVTEPYIFGMYCPFCRDVLAQGLKGRYDYLDGITLSQSCIHLRQSYVAWREHVGVPFDYYLYMPNKVQARAATPYLKSELVKYKAHIEEINGRELTDADLDAGIAAVNRNRELMHKVYEFRKGDTPKLTGLEAMYMTVSSTWIDKEEHSAEIEKVLEQLPDRQVTRDTGARLMLVGSEDDDVSFIDMIESVGATVVVDDHCTGTRYFWNSVVPDDDRLMAIADRYVKRPPCPTKDWEERWRFPHILELCKNFDVQGAVIIQQKFCDPHECDIMPLREAFVKSDIPSLFLEFDVTVPIGQFKVRVEAFLEMIGSEDLF
ncbi:benzoyl-CoA reductase, bzd-type, subunit N [candidate division LCP-89 bacterium B3_LCP]|uniref:Benzoyl-CoA reductase, bzd-type, subunit N n=1 Tax=candidate division LCP-89 bacterium B3_LCP TaxID=2012998 RepID=A0A532UYU6_UNCL8|nr:MAG: benzoyl-CoA reductase, bzd-type, subunit N [candidate division LCP-89 bacterium B3_LCP]